MLGSNASGDTYSVDRGDQLFLYSANYIGRKGLPTLAASRCVKMSWGFHSWVDARRKATALAVMVWLHTHSSANEYRSSECQRLENANNI